MVPSDAAGGEARAPIGVFDSGVGGLTVVRALRAVLPTEDIIYLGDTARVPYGGKSASTVQRYSLEVASLLLRENAKTVVVACNTASAAALDELVSELPVPVVGVIEPGARTLVEATTSGRVGVIGTVGTIASGAYQRAVAATGAPVELTCAACPGFVEFVERGDTTSDQVVVLAERLLAPLRSAEVDALLLGCTHYPFLARVISDVMGRDVVLVSSADETAFSVEHLLSATGLGGSSGAGRHLFLSSGEVSWFEDMGRRLFGPELAQVEPVNW